MTKDSTYVRSEVSYPQYGEPSYEVGVAHGGPIIDNTLGFRVSAWYRRDGGYIDLINPVSLQTEQKTPILMKPPWCAPP